MGQRIKAARRRAGMTQPEAAEIAGMERRQYQRVEAGQYDIRASGLARLSKTLGVPMEWFAWGEWPPTLEAAEWAGELGQVVREFREIRDRRGRRAVLAVAREQAAIDRGRDEDSEEEPTGLGADQG